MQQSKLSCKVQINIMRYVVNNKVDVYKFYMAWTDLQISLEQQLYILNREICKSPRFSEDGWRT